MSWLDGLISRRIFVDGVEQTASDIDLDSDSFQTSISDNKIAISVSASPRLVMTSGSIVDDLNGIGSGQARLIVDQALSVTGTVTVPSNVKIDLMGSGSFSIASGAKLILPQGFDAENRQVFTYTDETSKVEFVAGKTTKLKPQWWGFVCGTLFSGNSQLDTNATALKRMFAVPAPNAGTMSVEFPPGLYCWKGQIDLWQNATTHACWEIEGNGSWLYVELGAYEAAFQLGTGFGNRAAERILFKNFNFGGAVGGSSRRVGSSSVRIAQASRCRFERCSFGGHDYGVEYVEQGGIHNVFEQCSSSQVSIGRRFFGRYRVDSITHSTNRFTRANHGIPDGAILSLCYDAAEGSALPSNSTFTTPYVNVYAKVIDANTFELAATKGGATIDITDVGLGQVWYEHQGAILTTFDTTLNVGTGVFTTSSAHGFAANEPIYLHRGQHSTLPVPSSGAAIHYQETYYANVLSTTTFKLRRTSGGPDVAWTSGPTGPGVLLVGKVTTMIHQASAVAWRGGKIDAGAPFSDPVTSEACADYVGLDLFSLVDFKVEQTDFSNQSLGAVLIDACAEGSMRSVYSENVAVGTASPYSVYRARNSLNVQFDTCRVNGTGSTLNNNAKYGIRLDVCGSISINECTFTRHQDADVLVGVGCDSSSITIGPGNLSTNSLDSRTSVPITVANATGKRIVHNDAVASGLSKHGPARENLIWSQDLTHWSWTLTSGASIVGSETAPDGKGTATVLSFGTVASSVLKLTAAASGYSMWSADENVIGKELVLRFWYRPIQIDTAGSNDVGLLETYMIRTGTGTISKALQHPGVWKSNYGDWMLAEARFTPADDVNPSRYTPLTHMSIGASTQGGSGGVRIAIWNIRLDVVSQKQDLPPMLPMLDEVDVNRNDNADDLIIARSGILKRTVTYPQIVDAGAVTTVDLSLGNVPAGAHIVSAACALNTTLSGGTVTAAKLDIGTSGDVDAIVADADLFAAAVDTQTSTLPSGIAPNRTYIDPVEINARVRLTGGNANALTAGSFTPEVRYQVPIGTVRATPTDIGNAKLWLRSDDAYKTLSSYKVGTWKNASGASGFDAVQATDADRPYNDGRKCRGRKSVFFDGTSFHMTGELVRKHMSDRGFSVYGLLKIDSAVGATQTAGSTTSSGCSGIFSDTDGYWCVYANETQLCYECYDGTGLNCKIAKARSPGWMAFSLRHDFAGTTAKLRIGSSTSSATVNAITLGTFANSALRIGRSNANVYCRMHLVEAAIHDRPLSDAEDDLIMARLNRDAERI